ncbi:MAG TPA: VOC family protein [Chthonomonadaceae bacterium]|nr:VOC family protein [Chthonomonadaceae bacterium]
MAIEIRELNHVALHVRDLDASIRFYRDVLGLPPIPRPAFNFAGAWFALGRQELHLIADPLLESSRRRHHHFALLVDDTHAAKAELAAKGVTAMEGPAPRPDGPLQLFFHDPDGYRIELYHWPHGISR